MEGQVARGTQRFLWLSLRLSREWNFQSRKTLRKFFQSFLPSVLAVGPGDLHTTYLSRENHVFWANLVSFLNLFSFLSNISNCSSSSFSKKLSNSPCHSPKNFHSESFLSQIFKKKVWVFSLLLHISCFKLYFLEFVIRY